MKFEMNKTIIVFFVPLLFALSGKTHAQQSVFSLKARIQLSAGQRPAKVAVADVNRDGRPDVIVASYESDDITVLIGDGGGDFKQSTGSPFAAGNSPSDIAVGDFNKDGRLDLALPNHATEYVTVLFGDGNGGFSPAPDSPITIDVEPHAHSIATGDLNNDGNLDLALTNSLGDEILALYDDGTGSFTFASSTISVPPHPYRNVVITDINNDGNLDIITPANRQRAVTVLLGDGKKNFREAAGSPFPAGDNPFFTAVGDLNGDHIKDLVIANYDSGDATILFGSNEGKFTPAANSPFETGRRPVCIAIDDIDADGIQDAVITNWGSNTVAVLLGSTRDITAAPGSPFQVGQAPYGVAIADVNADNMPEIITANYNSNDVTVLFNQKGKK